MPKRNLITRLSCWYLLHCHTRSGYPISKTITGGVFRVKGQRVYLRRADGKEIHLHTKPTTEMKKEPKKGDRIEVKIDDEGNALSIR